MKDIGLQHFITAPQPKGLRVIPVHSIYRCGEHPSKPASGKAVLSRNSGRATMLHLLKTLVLLLSVIPKSLNFMQLEQSLNSLNASKKKKNRS